ncbi:twin-arginine translocation signal domain-containing protein [Halomicrococcus sp. SG-WS-1]|uniref:twin-arginine translocation signal domain-containing protein n=1 Tax=Halomicrococcus sp. SG-WS-1 TaxID=3439057 RepID=UPI003F78FC3F
MEREQPTSEQTTDEPTDESRRTFLKKGALATGAVALGVSGSNTAAAQQQQDVLTYFDDYQPGQSFRAIAQLPQDITVTLLSLPNGNTVPEISQPDDYNAYVIRPTTGQNDRAAGATYLFTRSSLNTDNQFRFGTSANVFSSQLSLVSTSASQGGGGGGGGGG